MPPDALSIIDWPKQINEAVDVTLTVGFDAMVTVLLYKLPVPKPFEAVKDIV